MSVSEQIITILAIAIATVATRALPFFVFSSRKRTPEFVQFLGKYLASAVFGMLVVYCVKDVQFLTGSHGFKEIVGIVVCVLLHLWKKNMLLTIAGGTAFYMLLGQLMKVC